MRALLPSGILIVLGACRSAPPPVPPGPPIPAEPELHVEGMKTECGAMVEALLTWKQCVNLDDEERDYIDAWVERANMDFAASDKAKPDDKALHQMAHNCRRATESVKAATERCGNGKRPAY
jgi:hypothetical protein